MKREYHPSDMATDVPWRRDAISLARRITSSRIAGMPLNCIPLTHSTRCASPSSARSGGGPRHVCTGSATLLRTLDRRRQRGFRVRTADGAPLCLFLNTKLARPKRVGAKKMAGTYKIVQGMDKIGICHFGQPALSIPSIVF